MGMGKVEFPKTEEGAGYLFATRAKEEHRIPLLSNWGSVCQEKLEESLVERQLINPHVNVEDSSQRNQEEVKKVS